jgi:hypothetical protein
MIVLIYTKLIKNKLASCDSEVLVSITKIEKKARDFTILEDLFRT